MATSFSVDLDVGRLNLTGEDEFVRVRFKPNTAIVAVFALRPTLGESSERLFGPPHRDGHHLDVGDKVPL